MRGERMNDAEYLFKQTEIERKKLGYGDKHKKRQGGRYVRTPSDNLSKKEREALNGEIKTWKEKPFYTWDEFKQLPDDVKLRWVNSILNRYDVGIKSIGEVVLGVSGPTVQMHLKKRGLREYINGIRNGGSPAIRANAREKLAKDVEEYRREIEKPTATGTEAPVAENKPEASTDGRKIEAASDMSTLALLLELLRGSGTKLTIEVVL